MRPTSYIAFGLALATATAAFGIATKARADIVIASDPGGNLDAYAARVEAVRRSGEPVIIDGPCNSACTLWLNLPQTCVTARAVFGFHTATNSLGLPDQKWNAKLWNSYPARVRIVLGAQGGLWLKPIFVKGELVAPRCR